MSGWVNEQIYLYMFVHVCRRECLHKSMQCVYVLACMCVMWCGVVWCGVVWCGVVWCGVGWGGVM